MTIQSLDSPRPAQTPLERDVFCMGTRLRIHLEGDGRPGLLAASNRILGELERIEAACSTWRPDSLWSRLNRAGGAAVAIEPEWMQLLLSAQDWRRRTRGAFDPALAALLAAWGVREGGRTPSAAALAQARQASGGALLVLDPVAGTARFEHPAAGLEEGGFVKGYALDAARAVAGPGCGWLDFGGQLLAWGAPLAAAIAAPEDRRRPRLRLLLAAGASLSCSGCSERGRHLLDPRTGRPSPDWGLVAVVAASGLEAEALSTALYIEGPEAGLALARELGAAAAFLGRDGGFAATPAFQALAPRPC
jgi:thiamine biosynthesis lipoprotein